MEPDLGPGTIHTGKNNLRIAVLLFASLSLILCLDVLTPLGLSVWILYFIPLYLTLYLEWRHGPFAITAIIIVLTYASYFLSHPDIALLFALLNRIFFTLMITASALLIAYYKQNVETLRGSEENYRILVEWSPDAIVVCRNRAIVYTNLSFVRRFSASGENLAGRDLLDIVRPSSRERVLERIHQAEMGAQVQAEDVQMIQHGDTDAHADLSLREVIWEGRPAVMVSIRIPG
jgi:PAS domain S-box-containing protein